MDLGSGKGMCDIHVYSTVYRHMVSPMGSPSSWGWGGGGFEGSRFPASDMLTMSTEKKGVYRYSVQTKTM